MEPSTLFRGLTGINNKVNPMRFKYDPDTGIGELAAAVNCDIDDTGMISRRAGQESVSALPSHSLFHDGGDCFVAQDRESDTAIYQIGSDFSLSGIRSGLTKGYPLSFCQVGDKTFYSNTVQNGVITGGISSAWPIGTYYGPETFSEYSTAPIGTHLAYYLGRIGIAVDNVIYWSEPYKPGLFRLAKCFFQFGSDIRMNRPVAGGIWVSDSEKIGFISKAAKWKDQSFELKASYPAHEWSGNQKLVDLSKSRWEIPGLSAVWSSDEGLCIGTPEGMLINTTEDKLDYPTGGSGATVVDGLNVINSVY